MVQTPGGSGRRSNARLGLHPGSPATRAAKKARKERLSKLGTASEKKDSNKVARLGLVVSLVVAVLSAVVSVVMTLVGAYNNREQSAEEFRRTQVQNAYSTFVAAANFCLEANWKYFEIRAEHPVPNDPTVVAERDRAEEATSKLESASSMVLLYGSTATASSAGEVVSEGYNLMYSIADPRARDGGDLEMANYTYKVQNDLRSSLELFVIDARKDLDGMS